MQDTPCTSSGDIFVKEEPKFDEYDATVNEVKSFLCNNCNVLRNTSICRKCCPVAEIKYDFEAVNVKGEPSIKKEIDFEETGSEGVLDNIELKSDGYLKEDFDLDNLSCNICNKMFNWRNGLMKHIKIVHQRLNEFFCHVCHRKFGQKFNLNRHMKLVHQGLKEFSCSVCRKKFSLKSYLKIHIATVHQQLKDHTCDNCQKRFSQKSSLKAHMKTVHQGLKNFSCNICHKKFGEKSNLKAHTKNLHR